MQITLESFDEILEEISEEDILKHTKKGGIELSDDEIENLSDMLFLEICSKLEKDIIKKEKQNEH